jgi:hypothetical protein
MLPKQFEYKIHVPAFHYYQNRNLTSLPVTGIILPRPSDKFRFLEGIVRPSMEHYIITTPNTLQSNDQKI